MEFEAKKVEYSQAVDGEYVQLIFDSEVFLNPEEEESIYLIENAIFTSGFCQVNNDISGNLFSLYFSQLGQVAISKVYERRFYYSRYFN